MGIIELTGHQPSVVAPLDQPVRHTATHARQGTGQPVYLPYLQHRLLRANRYPTITR